VSCRLPLAVSAVSSFGRGRNSGYPLPPHRPVLAQLTHTVLTLDDWRRNAQWETGGDADLW